MPKRFHNVRKSLKLAPAHPLTRSPAHFPIFPSAPGQARRAVPFWLRLRRAAATVTGENRDGFALIEVIGVLAILVILTFLLLPRISKRVNHIARVDGAAPDARVADTLIAIQSLKAAAQAHYAQFGTLGSPVGSVPAASANGDPYDAQLLREALLDRPFTAKVGTHALVRLVNVSGLSATAPVNGAPGAYDLDGDGRNDVVGERYVVEAVISDVTDADAQALNDRLDGPSLGADAQGNDLRGQVIWNGSPPPAPREVHIYVMRGR